VSEKARLTDETRSGAVVLLAALGVIAPAEAFSGFANSGMLIVAALFIVAAGLRETGVMDYVGDRFLGHVETEARAISAPCFSTS
jgi:di/tricarboxylate transporter